MDTTINEMAGLNAFHFSLARLEEKTNGRHISVWLSWKFEKIKCAIPSFGPKEAACNILFYFRVFKLEPPYAA